MPVVLWHMARCTGAEDFAAAEGVGAAFEDVASGLGREGFEELGLEGIAAEELGLIAGFL